MMFKPKNILSRIKGNYSVLVFFSVLLLAFILMVVRALLTDPVYLYAKVRVSNNNGRPGLWLVKAIKPGDKEKDLLGRVVAEVLTINYYPYYSSDQFDVFIDLKLRVSKSSRPGHFIYNRWEIAPGMAIELDFPSVYTTGMVLSLDNKPPRKNLEDKIIYLSKKAAYPWEYDAIKIGDSVSNGEEKVFEILDKTMSDINIISSDSFGNTTPDTTETKKYILVKARIRIARDKGQYVFAEEQIIRPGKVISVSTTSLAFSDYIIGSME